MYIAIQMPSSSGCTILVTTRTLRPFSSHVNSGLLSDHFAGGWSSRSRRASNRAVIVLRCRSEPGAASPAPPGHTEVQAEFVFGAKWTVQLRSAPTGPADTGTQPIALGAPGRSVRVSSSVEPSTVAGAAQAVDPLARAGRPPPGAGELPTHSGGRRPGAGGVVMPGGRRRPRVVGLAPGPAGRLSRGPSEAPAAKRVRGGGVAGLAPPAGSTSGVGAGAGRGARGLQAVPNEPPKGQHTRPGQRPMNPPHLPG